jgi:5'-nucleotidase
METWLLSAQGNLRDDATQALSFYGGVDRLATRLGQLQTANDLPGRTVLKLNAGDVILPGPRFNASLADLATAAGDGGQDYYDAIAMRALAFDATVFGNHEFDFGLATAARFADLAVTSDKPYLSFNIDFSQDAAFTALATSGKVAPYKVFTTKGGFQVGVIGVTTPLNLNVTSPEIIPLMDGFQGVSTGNTELQNLIALSGNLQPIIDGLRDGSLNGGNPVEVIVVLSHLQNYLREIQDFIPLLSGVDLVVSGGGHELTHVSTSVPGSTTIPTAGPVFGPAVGNLPYPTFATDLDEQQVPVVTAHFGNRYIGEITLDLDDATGAVTGVVAARTNRVSGRIEDTDSVTGDATLFTEVVTPVAEFIDALNTQVVGTTAVPLNGERGSTLGANPGTPRNFIPGVRNAETNLGNLVADSLRYAAHADVAIQNGGGVRASINGPSISVGDTFTTLTFLNLVVRADNVNATMLKAVLEFGYAASTTTGSAQGRYPQLSGVEVVYDTTRAANDRVRRVVLTRDPATTADDVVLIDYGQIVDNATTFSVASIDFLANGGDGYPFIANGFSFANLTVTRNYQEALVDFLTQTDTRGGLQALGGAVTSPRYGVVDPFVRGARRSLDMIYAGRLNDTITGTAGDDLIQGGSGSDLTTTGAGADTIIYTSIRDAGDRITDFEIGADKIDLSAIFSAASVTPVLGTNIVFAPVTGGVSVQIIINGRRTPMLTVLGVTVGDLNNPSNFIL